MPGLSLKSIITMNCDINFILLAGWKVLQAIFFTIFPVVHEKTRHNTDNWDPFPFPENHIIHPDYNFINHPEEV
jgi:hypothetical protein